MATRSADSHLKRLLLAKCSTRSVKHIRLFSATPILSSESAQLVRASHDTADHYLSHRPSTTSSSSRQSFGLVPRRHTNTDVQGIVGNWDRPSTLTSPSSSSATASQSLASRLRDNLAQSSQDTESPRKFKGVHDRRKRSQGTTPHEGAALNAIVSSIWRDMDKFGTPLAPSPSPITTPFGGKLFPHSGASLLEARESKSSDMDSSTEQATLVELDELKEELSSIQTDAELFEWAKKRVFVPQSTTNKGEPFSFSPSYPHMLAHLLKVARDDFNNPHLALAFFQFAQTHSIESYISGCLTPAYNELLRTRWKCFRDLNGVDQGVQEMESTGILWDRSTSRIVSEVVGDTMEMLRRYKNDRSLWRDHMQSKVKSLERRLEMDVSREEAIYEQKQEYKRQQRNQNPYARHENSYTQRRSEPIWDEMEEEPMRAYG